MKTIVRLSGCLVVLLTCTALIQPVGAEDAEEIPPLPQLRPGEVLPLAQALRLADVHNRSLKVLQQNLVVAKERLQASWVRLLPTVYAGMDYTLYDQAQTTTDESGQSIVLRDRHGLQGKISARMPLIHAKMWKGVGISEVQQEIAQLDFEQARQRLLYTLAETYYLAATEQRLIRVFEVQETALTRHLQDAKIRYRAGLSDLADVKRAQTNLVSVRESHAAAIFSLEHSRDALALLTGVTQAPLPQQDPQTVSFSPDKSSHEQLPSLQSRWDLRMARLSMRLFDKKLTAGNLQFVPTLDALFQYELDFMAKDESDRAFWYTGLSLTIPLLDARFYPEIGEQRALARQSELQLDDLLAQAQTEWWQQLQKNREAEYFISTSRAKSVLAEDTLRLSRLAYANGTVSALAVIDAHRSSQQAHVDYETRRLVLQLARLAYAQALGVDVKELFKKN